MTFVDQDTAIEDVGNEPAAPVKEAPPIYRVYVGSKIPVSSSVGKVFKRKYDAAKKAYEHIYGLWEEAFRYYNNDQSRMMQTSRGIFKRGDGTENIIMSNINTMLTAIYNKNPDISCSTYDPDDQPLCDTLQKLLNVLFQRKDGLNAKPKLKKACAMALLTNFGVFKLIFTQKNDSREYAIREMTNLANKLVAAKTQEEVDAIYGELEALEQSIEVYEPAGFKIKGVLPHNLTIDPYAEEPDGLDASWMAEDVFLATNFLTAKYTEPEEDAEDQMKNRVLVYKPTHKARFASGGDRDDGLGIVMDAINGGNGVPTSFGEDERAAYINMYFTECVYWWDRPTRRLFLFQKDDWSWPIWVWDDPMHITRFFPYFIISFVMSTGGTVSAGEVAYILDQQDEVNDINRQKSKIRRSVFDFFFYNSDAIEHEEAEKFVNTLRGETPNGKHLLGVKAGERKVSEIIEAVAPPSIKYEELFNKQPVLDTVNRIQNINDALRGVQFKTNTNVAAVKTYQDSTRLTVGSKVDVVEDTMEDLAIAVSEIAIQQYDEQMVADLIGASNAADWEQMDLPTFKAQYTVRIVAGTLEKPTSTFKKQEATELMQAVGQFAQSAPGATLRIMLKVVQKAFTEVVINEEDWKAIDQEIQASMNKGATDGGQQGGGQQPQVDPAALQQAAHNLPPQAKQKIVQMKESGASDQDILGFIQQAVGQSGV